MSYNIGVDPTKLDQAAASFAELSSTYSGIAKQLMNDATIMGEAWQGEDNLAFVTQVSGFTEELDAMARKLNTASEALTQQSTNYKNRQDAITTAARTLVN